MYNDEQKNRFINECVANNKTKDIYISLFNRIEKYEVSADKDLCFMNAEEISKWISNIVGSSATRRTVLSYLKKYIKWCIENVDGAIDSSSGIVIDRSETIKQKTVVNPTHMKRYLDSVFDPDDRKTNDSVYKCYLWMAYSGCPEDKIFEARKSNVDYSKMVFRFSEKEYPIYVESLQCIKNCTDLDYFVYLHPNYSNDIIRQRVEGDNILRGVRSGQNVKAFRVAITKKISKAIESGVTDIKLSHKRALMSGIFYRVYQTEQFGDYPSFKDEADKFMDGREYKLDTCRNTRNNLRDRIARDFKKDYEDWKTSYNL